MTVTIEIPNQIYLKMERFATQRTEPTSDVICKFISENINDTFEEWWSSHYAVSGYIEATINNLNHYSDRETVHKFDIW